MHGVNVIIVNKHMIITRALMDFSLFDLSKYSYTEAVVTGCC